MRDKAAQYEFEEFCHVIDGFALPTNKFTDVTETHRKFVYGEDVDVFIEKNRYQTFFTISGGILSCKKLSGMERKLFYVILYQTEKKCHRQNLSLYWKKAV